MAREKLDPYREGKDTIDVSLLQENQVFKNYHSLCEHLGIRVGLVGNSKKAQMKNLHRYFDYEKVAGTQQIIIKEIYDSPLPIQDDRTYGNKSLDFPQCKIKRSEWDNVGIYVIHNDDEYYIGSTANGFRKRFIQHISKNNITMKKTRELLTNKNGIFEIVEKMDNYSEEEIRDREKYYIKKYILEGYNVINALPEDKKEIKMNKEADEFVSEMIIDAFSRFLCENPEYLKQFLE